MTRQNAKLYGHQMLTEWPTRVDICSPFWCITQGCGRVASPGTPRCERHGSSALHVRRVALRRLYSEAQDESLVRIDVQHALLLMSWQASLERNREWGFYIHHVQLLLGRRELDALIRQAELNWDDVLHYTRQALFQYVYKWQQIHNIKLDARLIRHLGHQVLVRCLM